MRKDPGVVFDSLRRPAAEARRILRTLRRPWRPESPTRARSAVRPDSPAQLATPLLTPQAAACPARRAQNGLRPPLATPDPTAPSARSVRAPRPGTAPGSRQSPSPPRSGRRPRTREAAAALATLRRRTRQGPRTPPSPPRARSPAASVATSGLASAMRLLLASSLPTHRLAPRPAGAAKGRLRLVAAPTTPTGRLRRLPSADDRLRCFWVGAPEMGRPFNSVVNSGRARDDVAYCPEGRLEAHPAFVGHHGCRCRPH